MSRKQRAERRIERKQRQRRMLMIGGVLVVVAAVVVGALILIANDRDARSASTTATALAGVTQTVAARETEAAGGPADDDSGAARPQPTIIPVSDLPQWASPPEMSLDPETDYRATFVTEKGDIVVDLLEDEAPVTVNNFVFLARQGFYNNTTFHRVLPGFMAQAGDPSGTGTGGPGYRFEDETDNGLTFDGPGLLAMANAGPNTNGSQFFITYAPVEGLNGQHTIFGRVLEGQSIAESLTPRDPEANPTYLGDVLITVEITEIEATDS
ncbi:MAG: peptidylprolyl isomerase [Anaerolineae bacterium]|nr:peptidylprolyl isomerase [Anaerolineae bacterium]